MDTLSTNGQLRLVPLIKNNYIISYDTCPQCEKNIKFYMSKRSYICNNYTCRKSIFPFRGTLFSKLKLPVNIQLHILYEFLKKTPCGIISSSLEVNKNTVTAYYRIGRKYLEDKQYFNKNRKIGGRNKIVEIDESEIEKENIIRDIE